MPRLSSVHVLYVPGQWAPAEVVFTTTLPLFETSDTAVLQIVASVSAQLEFAIRLERNRVADVHLWDAARARRHDFSTEAVTVNGTEVRCPLPPLPVADVLAVPALRAQLVVNGALVQSTFPVELKPLHTAARELALA